MCTFNRVLVLWTSGEIKERSAWFVELEVTVGFASLILGVIGLGGVIIALIPLLNLLNCIALPIALLGAGLGLAELISYRVPGQGRGAAILGLIINGSALLIGLIRFLVSLFTTGGIV
jgi:hypothetical protein